MGKKNVAKVSFNAGQLSPELNARIDVNKYDNGVTTALNTTVSSRGPIQRRNGFKAIGIIKDSSAEAYFIRFQFAQDDAFIIEAGNQYFRFWRNDAPVLTTGTAISAITKANPGVVTSNSHGLSNGQEVYITGVVGMTEVNDLIVPFKVSSVTTNTFALTNYEGSNVSTASNTTYVSGGTVKKPYEITTPYLIADIAELNYEQFGDLIYITHPDYPVAVLTRNDTLNWTLINESFSPPPTYVDGYYPAMTITPSATTGTSVNFTASTSLFLQGDVGRQIINETAGELGTAVITSITSTTVAVADIITAFTNTTAKTSGNWKLDASPVAELTFSGTVAGSVVSVTANYPTGFKADSHNISGISKANGAVVTISDTHSMPAGSKIFIKDVQGMTEMNGRTLTATAVQSNNFTLSDGSGTAFNSTNFTTYASGGTVQRVFTEIAMNTFRSADIGKYILANDGVIKITQLISAKEVKGVVLKSLSTAAFTNNWSLETESWTASRGYPGAVGFYQQRLALAGTYAEPLEINLSEVGIFNGFGRGANDDAAIQADISAAEINQINWITNNKNLVVGTSGSEITINAPSASSGLSASNIRQEPTTSNGSKRQKPVKIGSEIIFVQGAGRKLLSFRYNFDSDNYDTEDLTYLAEDLTEGIVKQIAYAQEPDRKIYAVLEDGKMLCCTYHKAQEVIGWTVFETDGSFEAIQTISESNRDKVYVIVNRTINGHTRRYLEVMDNGSGEAVTDIFSDCAISYYYPKTVTDITKANPAVVTSAAHGFSNNDRVKLLELEGMTELTDTYLVKNKTTDTFELTDVQGNNINSTAFGTFQSGIVCKLINTLGGLEHLEGKTVELKGDNALLTEDDVTNGSVSLGEYCYAVTVGLPYRGLVELLPINIDAGQGPARGQQTRYVNPILELYQSALPVVNGQFLPARNTEDLMDTAVPLFTGMAEYGNMEWNKEGMLSITMDGPFPYKLIGIFGEAETNTR